MDVDLRYNLAGLYVVLLYISIVYTYLNVLYIHLNMYKNTYTHKKIF